MICEVQVRAPASHLAITQKAVPEENGRVRLQKSMLKLLRPRSGTAKAGQTGEHKHRAFPSRWQSLWAATCSLEKKVLPLLQNRLSSREKMFLLLCKFWAVRTDFVSWEMPNDGKRGDSGERKRHLPYIFH